MNEIDILAWLRNELSSSDPTVLVGSGPDDCAHVSVSADSQLAVTTDTIVEGVHFNSDTDPAHIGWKTVAVNISDLAASGCEPCWAVVNLCLRRGLEVDYIQRFARGLIDCADHFSLRVVGGDMVSSSGPTSVSLTAIGRPLVGGPLLRSGARPGDSLIVTGQLGGSIHGRHLRFMPRLPEIRRILEWVPVHACMDISDGLSLDLSRLVAESKCGAIIEAQRIPVSSDIVRDESDSSCNTLNHALADGEDFELLMSLAPEAWETLDSLWGQNGTGVPLTRIGEVIGDEGELRLVNGKVTTSLFPQGYVHEL